MRSGAQRRCALLSEVEHAPQLLELAIDGCILRSFLLALVLYSLMCLVVTLGASIAPNTGLRCRFQRESRTPSAFGLLLWASTSERSATNSSFTRACLTVKFSLFSTCFRRSCSLRSALTREVSPVASRTRTVLFWSGSIFVKLNGPVRADVPAPCCFSVFWLEEPAFKLPAHLPPRTRTNRVRFHVAM